MFAVYKPWASLLLSLLVVFFCAAGAQRVVVESDYEIFFDEVSPRLAAHYEVENLFGRNDFVQIAITPKEGDVFQLEVLSSIEKITEQFWQISYSRRVDSLTNAVYTVAEEDDLTTTPLFEDAASFSKDDFAKRKHYALTNVASKNFLVAETGLVTGIAAIVLLPEGDHMAPIELAAEFEQLVSELQQTYPFLEIRPYGSILLNKAFFTHATEEYGKLIAIGIVLLLVTAAWILRSILAAICILMLMSCSVMAGLGVTGWLSIPLTAPSSSSSIIVMALSVACTIHLIAGYLKRLGVEHSKISAVKASIKENFKPIFLTSLTTAVGFLCLNISAVPPYRFLGNTTAIGVGMAFALSFTLLPALLVLLPFKAQENRSAKTMANFWKRFGARIASKPGLISALSLLLIIAMSLPIQKNVIDDKLLTYFDKEVPIRADTEYVMENYSSFYGAFMPIPSGESYGITSPDYLNKLDEYLHWARQQPEVKVAVGFSDVIKQLNKNMNGDQESFYQIPDNRELIAQYLLLYELSLPFGKDLSTQIDSGRSASLVRLGFHDISSADMRIFEERSQKFMTENLPPNMQSHLTGPPMLFAHIWNDATKSNLMGMGLAVFLICSLIGLAMKSFKMGAISLLPNILPALMAFGLWGVINGQIDIGSSIVAVIAFGIIVDDTIHFLHRYRYFRQQGESYASAIELTFASVGTALFTTTVVLALGFGVLAISNFTLNSSMGMLTSITIVLALIVDFVFLPAFLGIVDRDK